MPDQPHVDEAYVQALTNHQAYQLVRDHYERRHLGKAALMHDGEVAHVYDEDEDAYYAGCEGYGLGHFSIETIGSRPVSLGFMSLLRLPK